MLAHHWYDQSIQIDAIDGRSSAAHDDDDEIMDDWLASLSVSQFERILDLLMEQFGSASRSLGRLA